MKQKSLGIIHQPGLTPAAIRRRNWSLLFASIVVTKITRQLEKNKYLISNKVYNKAA